MSTTGTAPPGLILPPGTRPSTDCPQCGEPRSRRIHGSGFGPPIVICGGCGWEFKGETKP